MFAHQVVEFSGPAGVVWTELPEPTSLDGVIVDVVAAGVSYADLLQTHPFRAARVALSALANRETRGKSVLSWRSAALG